MSTDLNTVEVIENGDSYQLKITINNSTLPQKIFLKPASDYGVVSAARDKSAVEYYLKVLRDESLSITDEAGRSLTFKLGEGDSYQTGFYVSLSGFGRPEKLGIGTEVSFDVAYNGEDKVRVDFEVI